ncbi:MAG: amidase [Candidatus Binatus sp.]|uniref:amidase n=1 Tax=Candidatus Binatus sp. TaxID=2811406 RepID=UPI00272728E6|nr:amidase [Candidatus Binatus sp.]MDO8432604.1 amidase [Candidatus Binatus sp.]
MSELAYSSAITIANRIRSREISSREALDYFLARVEALDQRINCVVTIDAERARKEADAADAALARGEVSGPLHGVPITIKDSFQTRGMRTTSGAPELADFVPEEDAWPVARLREAGAIIYGKTNAPIYAGDLQSYNEVFGTTNNPYDVSRTPGGSSGGSAAALACGFTPLELGSDIGGSIRLPSHMSGIAGHKPSYGIVPAHGQIPGPPGTLTMADLAVAGPMARTVEDLELGLDLMAGPNRWERPAWRLDLPQPRHQSLKQYRIAAWLDDPRCRVEPEMRDLLEKATRMLAQAGAWVDYEARPAFTLEKAVDTFFALLQAALAGGVALNRIEGYAASPGDTPAARTKRQLAIRHREWLTYNERRLQMRKRWEEFFTQWDAILLPVMPCPAIPHDHSEPQATRIAWVGGEQRPYWDLTAWMAPAGVCYLPATVIPVGCLSTGLPVGIQIVGPYLHDRTTLSLAKHFLALLGGCPRPPGF